MMYAFAHSVEDGCVLRRVLDTGASMNGQTNAEAQREPIAERFTRVAERVVPDAFVFALLATCIVVLAAGVHGTSIGVALDQWGSGVWDLLPFMTQMSLVVIAGHVLASSAPVAWIIERLAAVPKSAKSAVAYVTFFSMVSSWFNWGFSLIFSAMLALAIARRLERVDYRTLAASSLLGLGSVWAQGLSGSAALQMATPSALPESIRAITQGGLADNQVHIEGGVIALRHTIFLWQSFVTVGVEIALLTLLMYAIAPTETRAKSAKDLGIALPERAHNAVALHATSFAEHLEHSRVLALAVASLGLVYIARSLSAAPSILSAISLNTLNLAFLMLALVLHQTPYKFMNAVKEATPAVWGILLQFPFYAGIGAVLVKSGLSESIAHAFVSVSTKASYPALIALYSAALGFFVPSGGSKWIIEAPYVMRAAHDLHVHLGWMVAVYDLGEALANLVQPFWMLPVLALFKLRAKDVMGTTTIVFIVLTPIVLLLVTLLGATLPYPL
jgi:short-chain fatty acids transporter